jgi:hypothetical protein
MLIANAPRAGVVFAVGSIQRAVRSGLAFPERRVGLEIIHQFFDGGEGGGAVGAPAIKRVMRSSSASVKPG